MSEDSQALESVSSVSYAAALWFEMDDDSSWLWTPMPESEFTTKMGADNDVAYRNSRIQLGNNPYFTTKITRHTLIERV